MSLGCGFLENIPHFTFTPPEHQVECARVSQNKNVTYVLTHPHEKSFLALMAIKARSNSIRCGEGKAGVLLHSRHQVGLWAGFLARMTDLVVEQIGDDIDLDTGQVLNKLDRGGVIVGTHNSFSGLIARKLINLSAFNLLVIDNLQASLKSGNVDSLLNAYRSMPKNRAPRLVFFLPNILNCNKNETQHLVPKQLQALEKLLPAAVECSSEITTQLRFLARPFELISLYKGEDLISAQINVKVNPEQEIFRLTEQAKSWFKEHNYSLYDTYGEEFGDLIADIPDPTATPLRLITDFQHVLDQLGLWSADRAALLLMITIEKLKTREKYERHFLLLSVLFTLMLKIRKICDDYYGDLTEHEKIVQNSRPKLLKLMDLLGNYAKKKSIDREKIKNETAIKDITENADKIQEVSEANQEQDESQKAETEPEITESLQGSKTIEHIKETEKEESNNEPTDATVDKDSCALASRDKTDVETSKTDNDNDNDVVADTKTEDKTNMEVDQVEAETDASKAVTVENNSADETEGSKTGIKHAPGLVAEIPENKKEAGVRRKGTRRTGPLPEDPEALCSILLVDSVFSAKIIYHFFKDLSRSDERYSFLCPQYCVSDPVSTDSRDIENEKKKREETLRRFRMRECNILVTSDVLEEGIDFVKCNLVMLFDMPSTFNRYIYSKVKCKSVFGSVIYLSTAEELSQLKSCLGTYKHIESELLNHCYNKAAEPSEDFDADKFNYLLPAYPQQKHDETTSALPTMPIHDPALPIDNEIAIEENVDDKTINDAKSANVPETKDDTTSLDNDIVSDHITAATDHGDINQLVRVKKPVPNSRSDLTKIPKLSLNTSILVLNRYCAKLPSDTFTRLTPIWTVQRTSDDKFYCALFLPINSPLKDLIVGNVMPTGALARRAAAYQACVKLHSMGELDNNMIPLGKESVMAPQQRVQINSPEDVLRPGTTKRRQYYYKRIAPCLIRSNSNQLATITEVNTETENQRIVEEIQAKCKDLNITEDNIPKEIENVGELETPELVNDSTDVTEKESTEDATEVEEIDTSEYDRLIVKYPNIKYYNKQTDKELRDRYENIRLPESATYNLYALRMRLTCPIPEEQNTRGRKIHDPLDSTQMFGLLLPNPMPVIPAFPIYTRSGEVLVETELVQSDISLTRDQLSRVFTYHIFTFYSVLRLEKYPMVFNSSEEHNCVVFVPLVKSAVCASLSIDWNFLELIEYLSTRRLRSIEDKERKEFVFETDSYTDAVIMPWYRNQDQPQYFYVAEICHHLNPTSDFPGQGFETFEKYYGTKYGINIQNASQPLLDVDHTSARLNFLTPRYVNRKGIALPTSSEETKRNKRENLDQKQILVPELCAIHPFSASLWRQTVALPCTMYRLNGLLIADQIRHKVSLEMRMGTANLDHTFRWPALNFGWTLADVVKNSRIAATQDKQIQEEAASGIKKVKAGSVPRSRDNPDSENEEEGEGGGGETIGHWSAEIEEMDISKVNEQLMSKLAAEERLMKKKKLEIGTWDNTMANQGEAWGDEADGEGGESDDDEIIDMDLPDNLTFLNSKKISKVMSNSEKGTANWVSGIESKNFRVGSPTCFTSSASNNMAGLMDDLAGFSCSDSEEDWLDDDATDSDSAGPAGQGRIEFHGDNLAEAIEEEEAAAAREERQAKDRDQEASMVQDVDWDPIQLLPEAAVDSLEEALDVDLDVYNEDQTVKLMKPRHINKSRDVTDVPKGLSSEETVDEQPEIPVLKDDDDIELVLSNLSLSPDLSCVKAKTTERPPGVIPWPGIDQDQILFDEEHDLGSHPGPSPSLILQALTMSNSNDAINLERLETIGDSFLKYAITSYLYCQYPDIHEGKLSHLRSKQVSNLNLYQLGRASGLGECMIATKFEPHDNWLPPCYHVPRELEKALIESGVPSSHWNMADLPGVDKMSSQQICQLLKEKCERSLDTEEIQDLPSFVPYNLLTQHSIPDKSIADCVEALIGAYLISCGPRGALLLMTWLGLSVLPGSRNAPGYLVAPPSPLIPSPWITDTEKHLSFLLDGYSKFEQMIGYVWKDKSYLMQAFSHASYTPNRLTDCYQRLEFLGDAVLDYLITRYLYQDSRLHSPGALTDLRSALVNNTIFACLAVRHDFHKYFKHQSPGLQLVCDRFVRIQAENGWKVSEDCYLIDEDESEEAEDIEVPKALGDIFESVAGSIYLDSGLSLDAVWKVYFRMMKDEIEQFSSHVPKSPIRELLELEPETAKFGKPEKLADGRRVRVSVEVFGKGVFKGIGRNYRIAKCTAAKCALKALRKMETKNKKKFTADFEDWS